MAGSKFKLKIFAAPTQSQQLFTLQQGWQVIGNGPAQAGLTNLQAAYTAVEYVGSNPAKGRFYFG
jgi:hypothetical protein